MADIEKILKAMECSLRPCKERDNCKECGYRLLERVDDKIPCPPDVEENGIKYWESCDCDGMVKDAIETIRELQEQLEKARAHLDFNYKSGYEKGKKEATKWHLCSEEYPKESGYYLVAYHEWSNGNFLPKYDDTRVKTMHFQNSEQYVGWNYPRCCDERAEKDTYREVIAWRELPKFEEVE